METEPMVKMGASVVVNTEALAEGMAKEGIGDGECGMRIWWMGSGAIVGERVVCGGMVGGIADIDMAVVP